MYDFDKIIDRSGSDDLKHGALLPRWGRDDLLPPVSYTHLTLPTKA